jgi:uncharacterized Zn-binding protein involved in type VI secretion
MPPVSRAGDSVLSFDGGPGKNCPTPMTTSVGEVNGNNVYANGLLIVVEGNTIAPHPKLGCSTDTSTLSSFSSTVKIGGKGIGRIGDEYGPNLITAGSGNVFAGG